MTIAWPGRAALGLALLTSALMAAGNAAAQPPAAPASAPPPSKWLKIPTRDQLMGARPPEVLKDGGRAVVRCRVDAAGAVSNCATLSETPSGSGYARGLAALGPSFQMRPERVTTDAADGTVVIIDAYYRQDTPPSWVHKPTEHDLVVVWPKAAWANHIGGRAVIACMLNLQGALYDCIPTEESPAGEHFGAAAVALTPQFLMKPGSYQGVPAVSPVNVPIVFIMPKGGGAQPGRNDLGVTAPAAMAWAQAPSYADVAAAYPQKAREANLAGHATINCAFTIGGRLIDCTTVTEEPKGQGFGAAAHILARKFQAPDTLQGQSLKNASVQLPFSFDPAMLTGARPAIGKPQWAGLPNGAETAAAFDAVAKSGAGTVRVMLNCTVQAGGGVSECAVAREEPAGKGVGQAALSLTPHFKITTWTTEGLPTVGGTVNIPLRYEGEAPAAPAAKP